MATPLQELEKTCRSCVLCDLHSTRTNVVFGRGNSDADIMFIGEAPGKNEDLEGSPFVGAAGKQLKSLLTEAGISEDNMYIANILKCRPPNNRDPSDNEIKTCTPYLIEQIRLISPRVICTLGNYSTKFILARCVPEDMKKISGITSLHGKEKKIIFDNKEYSVMPLFHPAATLYRRALMDTMNEDFHTLKKLISESSKTKTLDKF